MRKAKTCCTPIQVNPTPETDLAKAIAKQAKQERKDAEDKADLIQLVCFILLGALLYRYWVIVAFVVGLYYWGRGLTPKKTKREWRYTKSGKLKYKKVKR